MQVNNISSTHAVFILYYNFGVILYKHKIIYLFYRSFQNVEHKYIQHY